MTTTLAVHQVYGIVDATAELPDDSLPRVCLGSVAAVVSEPLPRPPRPNRAALLAHASLLDRIVLTTAVLPARFGTVLDEPQLLDMLATHETDFRTALTTLHGKVQYTVKAHHDRDQVLREILATDPEVTRLQELAAAGQAAHVDLVRLGELVAHGLTAATENDTVTLWEHLTAHAAAAVPRQGTTPDAPFGGAFLVEHGRRAAFEAAAEGIAQRWTGRARVRLLGPLAPYDFVTSASEPAVGRQ